jgi:dolichol-phosphate mannosyltransferase
MSGAATLTPRAQDVSVIVPTYCEAPNIPVLVERLRKALAGLDWEMIVVDDDSPDGTSDVVVALAATDRRIRCIRRVGRSGLAGAVIEGCLSSSAPLVAVIDADLQHDESILPRMARPLIDGEGDLAIATRARADGAQGLSTARQRLSDAGAWVFRRISGLQVSDPMSGFFVIRRDIVSRVASKLSPDGFKILADILLLEGRALRIVETSYLFARRRAGESKLSPLVAMEFIGLIAHHASAGFLPLRFVLFASIGAFGLLVHLAVLSGLLGLWGKDSFLASQLVATLAAISSNFILNNEITYRANRYRGVNKLAGLALFAALCGVGIIANINVASWLFAYQRVWWVAGLAGALVGVVWNYAVSSSFVWRRRARQ